MTINVTLTAIEPYDDESVLLVGKAGDTILQWRLSAQEIARLIKWSGNAALNTYMARDYLTTRGYRVRLSRGIFP